MIGSWVASPCSVPLQPAIPYYQYPVAQTHSGSSDDIMIMAFPFSASAVIILYISFRANIIPLVGSSKIMSDRSTALLPTLPFAGYRRSGS